MKHIHTYNQRKSIGAQVQKQEAGFTLVELMLSTVFLALVSLLVYQFVYLAQRSDAGVTTNAAQTGDVGIALDIMDRYLSSSTNVQALGPYDIQFDWHAPNGKIYRCLFSARDKSDSYAAGLYLVRGNEVNSSGAMIGYTPYDVGYPGGFSISANNINNSTAGGHKQSLIDPYSCRDINGVVLSQSNLAEGEVEYAPSLDETYSFNVQVIAKVNGSIVRSSRTIYLRNKQ